MFVGPSTAYLCFFRKDRCLQTCEIPFLQLWIEWKLWFIVCFTPISRLSRLIIVQTFSHVHPLGGGILHIIYPVSHIFWKPTRSIQWYIYLGCGPLRVKVTTKFITCFIGESPITIIHFCFCFWEGPHPIFTNLQYTSSIHAGKYIIPIDPSCEGAICGSWDRGWVRFCWLGWLVTGGKRQLMWSFCLVCLYFQREEEDYMIVW